jgi:hypothetical protein
MFFSLAVTFSTTGLTRFGNTPGALKLINARFYVRLVAVYLASEVRVVKIEPRASKPASMSTRIWGHQEEEVLLADPLCSSLVESSFPFEEDSQQVFSNLDISVMTRVIEIHSWILVFMRQFDKQRLFRRVCILLVCHNMNKDDGPYLRDGDGSNRMSRYFLA